MLVDVICVGDVWIWVGFWGRLGGSGFGSKMEDLKVRQKGENIISQQCYLLRESKDVHFVLV